MYFSCNIWNKLTDNASFFTLFTTFELESHSPHSLCFSFFWWTMLGDSINIFNFNCNPVVLKKIDKTCKKKFFGPTYTRKGSVWVTPKTKNYFFCRNNKSRSKAFKNVLYYKSKYHICFGWVMNLFLPYILILNFHSGVSTMCSPFKIWKKYWQIVLMPVYLLLFIIWPHLVQILVPSI